MATIKSGSIDEFYEETANFLGKDVTSLLPPDIQKNIGHFNVFDISETIQQLKRTKQMPYNRRSYYKISLIRGRNSAEYADKIIDVQQNALLFATPKIPYRWIPKDEYQGGCFVVFTADFMTKSKTGLVLDELPLFQPGSYPVFEMEDEQAEELMQVFNKIKKEIVSDYAFKYDLIRNYVIELIHAGQKLQPIGTTTGAAPSGKRISALFAELLERQFPIDHTQQRLVLRTAQHYARQLSVHVNHLNKVLKEETGSTTTSLINKRVLQEAKLLLRQTGWSVSEIAYTLGFEEVAHFSNFFKKHTQLTPGAYRT